MKYEAHERSGDRRCTHHHGSVCAGSVVVDACIARRTGCDIQRAYPGVGTAEEVGQAFNGREYMEVVCTRQLVDLL